MIIRKYLFGVLVSLVASTVFAQQSSVMDKMRFGAKGGMNVSSVILTGNSYSTMYNYEARIGFYAGGYAEYPILDFLSVRTELYYNNIGSNIDLLSNSNIKAAERTQYISVPILAKASLPSVPNLYATLGVGFNILLSRYYIPKNSVYDKTNWSSFTKNVNPVFVTSVGYHFIDNLAAEIGFGYSLSTPYKNPDPSTVSMFRYQYVQFGLAYRIK